MELFPDGVDWKRDRAHHHDARATVNNDTNGGGHGVSVGMVAYECVHGTGGYLDNVSVFLPGAAGRSCCGTGRPPDILGYQNAAGLYGGEHDSAAAAPLPLGAVSRIFCNDLI